MYSFLVLAGVLFLVMVVLAFCDRNGHISILALAAVCIPLCLVSLCVTDSAYPTDLVRAERVYYIAETGNIEFLEGDYYTDGSNYYSKELGRAAWIPFAPPEYVVVEVPGEPVPCADGYMVAYDGSDAAP